MKKMLFMLSMLMVCILSSCGGFKSETKPLLGNETLTTFTALAEDGKTVLTGVSDQKSGQVIVSPADFISITADKDVIVCRATNDKFYTFKTNGELLGVFDLFTHWTENGDYYIGSKYGLQVLYFPTVNEIVQCTQTFSEIDAILLFVEGTWQIRDYFGKLLWTIPAKFTLVRELQHLDVFVIVIKEGNKYVVYDKNGKKLKTLTSKKWQQLQSKFESLEVTENGASAANVETLAPFI